MGVNRMESCYKTDNKMNGTTLRLNGYHVETGTVSSSSELGTSLASTPAVQLVYQTVYDMTGVCMDSYTSSVPNERYFTTMKRLVTEISERHSIIFKSMVEKLSINRSSVEEVLKVVLDEMFVDGEYNWGRVVSVYAFVGWLARYCVENGFSDYVTTIGETAGRLIALRLEPWISANGGWGAFVKYFEKPPAPESTLFRGLLYTVLGIGAVVTMVVVR